MNTASIPTHRKTLSRFGLRPVLVILILATDILLSGGEAGTGGFFLIISIFVSILIGTIAFLWQWFSGRDRFMTAFAKGLAIAILMAIPSPLATLLPLLAGFLSFVPSFQTSESAEEQPAPCDAEQEPSMRTARGRVVSTRE